MSGFRFVTIKNSVGRGGGNTPDDVSAVQEIINARLPAKLKPLKIDGLCGALTIHAIEEVERMLVGARQPDGRIDPNGRTLRELNHLRRPRPTSHPLARATTPAAAAPQRAPLAGSFAPPVGGSPPQATLARANPDAKPSGIPQDVIDAAKAAQQKWSVPASVSIAQWVLESGSGKHMPLGSNNPFGIKAGKGQPSVTSLTREETADGRSVHIKAPFRKFASLSEAFDEHGRLLATHRAYAAARTHTNDPDAYADALTHTYATDSHYGRLLKSIMSEKNLYQYN